MIMKSMDLGTSHTHKVCIRIYMPYKINNSIVFGILQTKTPIKLLKKINKHIKHYKTAS